jgi:hypothetical protein
MDPIHPIVPITPGVRPITALPATRRINPDSRRESGRDPREGEPRDEPRRDFTDDGDEPDSTPHIDITA